MQPDLPRLAGLIYGTPLMIARPKLDVVLGVLRPRLFGGDSCCEPADPDQPLEPYAVTADGIAIIPVVGTLVARTMGLTALSGLTSYQLLTDRLDQAAGDPAVRGILLDIESGGGQVGGVFDLADRVAALRGVKPVYAVANDACFSAAYAIACGAERLYITRTGGMGSIGVVALHVDQSAADAQAGLKYEYLSAGARKTDGNPHAPLSDDARTALLGEVDRLYGLLVAQVARCRGLSEAQVRDQQAAPYYGENAVAAGLADQVGTAGAALADLGRRVAPRPVSSPASSPKGPLMTTPQPGAGGAGDPPPPAPQATSSQPASPQAPDAQTLRNQLAARAEGVSRQDEATIRAEAAEIMDLCQLAGQPPAVAADYIRAGTKPADVRKALLTGEAARADAVPVHTVDPRAPGGVNPLKAAIQAAYPAKPKGV